MKNIIFDIGNVLLSFQPENYLSQYFNATQMGDLMTIIFSSDEWVDLDMGTLLIQGAIDSLANKHPHYHDEIIFVLENWTEMLTTINDNVQIAYDLKEAGYHLYLLSNFHSEAIQTMFQKYDFFQLFEGSVISAYEHVVKPDEKIYQILLEKYQLDPQECLFIDDSLANIHTGQRLGIQGIHLPYQANLRSKLQTLNLLKK